MMTDLLRGLARLKSNSVECLVLMADSQGESLNEGLQEFVRWKRTSSTAAIVVLSKSQAGWKNVLEEAGSTRDLVQPIQLRDLRTQMEAAGVSV